MLDVLIAHWRSMSESHLFSSLNLTGDLRISTILHH